MTNNAFLTNTLEAGNVIALNFGEDYNKNGAKQNQTINPMSLNRFWLVVSTNEQISYNGVVTLLPIRSLKGKYNDGGIDVDQIYPINESENHISMSVCKTNIPADCNLEELTKGIPDGAFVAQRYPTGIIYSAYGIAEEVVCDMPRSFLVKDIIDKYMIKSKVSVFVLNAARALMLRTLIEKDPLTQNLLNEFARFQMPINEFEYKTPIKFRSKNDHKVPTAMAIMKRTEQEVGTADEEVPEETEDFDTPETLTITNGSRVVANVDREQETEPYNDTVEQLERLRQNTLSKLDKVLNKYNETELYKMLYTRLKLDRVDRISLHTIIKGTNEVLEEIGKELIVDITELKSIINIKESAITVKGRKELINSNTAITAIKKLAAKYAYTDEVSVIGDPEISVDFSYLQENPNSWSYSVINVFIRHMMQYGGIRELIDASNLSIDPAQKRRLMNYSTYSKKLKCLRKITDIMKIGHDGEWYVDYSAARFDSSIVDEALEEAVKDASMYDWKVGGRVVDDFFLAKYLGFQFKWKDGLYSIEDISRNFKSINNHALSVFTYLASKAK